MINRPDLGTLPPPAKPADAIHGTVAANLNKVLNAAPTLIHHPDLAHASVVAGGDVASNAQSLAGFHLINTVTNAVMKNHGEDYHNQFHTIINTPNMTANEKMAAVHPILDATHQTIKNSLVDWEKGQSIGNIAEQHFLGTDLHKQTEGTHNTDFWSWIKSPLAHVWHEISHDPTDYLKSIVPGMEAAQTSAAKKFNEGLAQEIGSYNPLQTKQNTKNLANAFTGMQKTPGVIANTLIKPQNDWQLAQGSAEMFEPAGMSPGYQTPIPPNFDPKQKTLTADQMAYIYNQSQLPLWEATANAAVVQIAQPIKNAWTNAINQDGSYIKEQITKMRQGNLSGATNLATATAPLALGPVGGGASAAYNPALVKPLSSAAATTALGVIGGSLAQMINTPQQAYRYYYLVYKRYGLKGLGEALTIPVAGAIAGFALEKLLVRAEFAAGLGATSEDSVLQKAMANYLSKEGDVPVANESQIENLVTQTGDAEKNKTAQSTTATPKEPATTSQETTALNPPDRVTAETRNATNKPGEYRINSPKNIVAQPVDLRNAMERATFPETTTNESKLGFSEERIIQTNADGTPRYAPHTEISPQIVNDVTNIINETVNDKLNGIGNKVVSGLQAGYLDPTIVSSGADVVRNKILDYNAATPMDKPMLTDQQLETILEGADKLSREKLSNLYEAYQRAQKRGLGFRVGRQFALRTAGTLLQPVGALFKLANTAGESAVWGSAQMATWALSPHLYGDLWQKAAEPSKNLGSIGQAVWGKNNPMQAITDFFVTITSGPFMLGRLMGASKGAAEPLIVNEDFITKAWASMPRYRIALKLLEGKTPAEMMMLYPQLAHDLGNGETMAQRLYSSSIKSGEHTAMSMHQSILSMARAGDWITSVKLPTSGLYGIMRLGKLSDKPWLNYISTLFAQSPTMLTKEGLLTARAMDFGSTKSIPALQQAMRQIGFKPIEIKDVTSQLLENPANTQLWQRVWEKTISDWLTKHAESQMLKGIPEIKTIIENAAKTLGIKIDDAELRKLIPVFDNEGHMYIEYPAGAVFVSKPIQELFVKDLYKELEPYRKDMVALYQSIDETAAKLTGKSGMGESTRYGFKRGTNPAETVNVGMLENFANGALFFTQQGKLLIPNYRIVDRAIKDIMTPIIKRKDFNPILEGRIRVNSGFFKLTDWTNLQFQDKLFKPLVLLTGGWATRVSLSEASLNTARLGVGDMAAGYTTQSLIKQQQKAMAGFGKDNVIEAATGRREIAYMESISTIAREMARGRIDTKIANFAEQMPGPWASEFAVMRAATEIAPWATGLQKMLDRAEKQGLSESQISKGLVIAKTIIREHLDKQEEIAIAQAGVTEYSVGEILKGWKITKAVSREIAMTLRGVMSGLDESILLGVGRGMSPKEFFSRNKTLLQKQDIPINENDFVKFGAELLFRHDGYLPLSLSATHEHVISELDNITGTNGKEVGAGLFWWRKALQPEKIGQPATKKYMLANLGDSFREVGYNTIGYWDGWSHMASQVAHDGLFGRKIARAWVDLIDSGLTEEEAFAELPNKAAEILNNLPVSTLNGMDRSYMLGMTHAETGTAAPLRAPGTGYNSMALQSWAEDASSALDYIVHGSNGLFHESLLRAIADNSVPNDFHTFMQQFGLNPTTGQRWSVGEVPNSTLSRIPEQGGGAAIQRIASYGHDKILGPMVNNLVRQPVYIAEYAAARKSYAEAIKQGIITEDQSMVLSEIEATQHMIRFIHNPIDKTKFEELMRVYSPFYFAKNQAWRRVGRLFVENPGAFAQYMYSMTRLVNWINSVSKKTGTSSVVIPLSMYIFGGPLTAGLTAAQVIDPLADGQNPSDPQSPLTRFTQMIAPAPGYITTFLEHLILMESAQGIKNVTGLDVPSFSRAHASQIMGPIATSESPENLVIPNSGLKNLAQTLEGIMGVQNFNLDPSWMQAKSETMFKNMANEAAQYKKHLEQTMPNKTYNDKIQIINQLSAWEAQNWFRTPAQMDAIANGNVDALKVMAGKIAVGIISPLSTGIGDVGQQPKNQLQEYLKKYGYPNGLDKFFVDNPTGSIETFSRSKSTTGFYVPSTKPVYDYVQNNFNLVQKHPYGAFLFAPDFRKNPGYYQPTITTLITADLRNRLVPREALDQFAIQSGQNWYYNVVEPWYEKYKNTTIDGIKASKYKANWVASYGALNYTWARYHSQHEHAIDTGRATSDINQTLAENQNKYPETVKAFNYFMKIAFPELTRMESKVKSGHMTTAQLQDWWMKDVIKIWADDPFYKKIPYFSSGLYNVFGPYG